MTIIRGGKSKSIGKEFVIIGVGGAGAKSATEMSKLLGNPDDVIAVDRNSNDLSSVLLGRRVAIGYPIFHYDGDAGRGDAMADASDLLRLKTAMGKPSIVFVMAGLGGKTTMELLPSVLRTVMDTSATVIAIVTLPFAFEGQTRNRTAEATVTHIKESGCTLALIDANRALPQNAVAGDLASELSVAKAKVVMNVLSASAETTSGRLNTNPEILDAVKCGGMTFVSYSSTENASEYRKTAKHAVNNPITYGLELSDADCASVVVAGPPDMSIKALNAVITIVQEELSSDAVLSTSFVSNANSARANRLRVSILAGKMNRLPKLVETFSREQNGSQIIDIPVEREDEIEPEFYGAPSWLVREMIDENTRTPIML